MKPKSNHPWRKHKSCTGKLVKNKLITKTYWGFSFVIKAR